MFHVGRYHFKRAESSHEIEQIHRLNYRTFVEEIPQHADTGAGLLVDKFHTKNTYYIGLRDGRVVGMISVHDQPPFSVTDRLGDPTILQRPEMRPLEVRLLAVEPDERHSTMFVGLGWCMIEHARLHGHTDVFISGFSDRLGLYRGMGFEPLGPAVRSGAAEFVAMGVTLQGLQDKLERFLRLWRNHMRRVTPEPVCLLPGPVTTSRIVQAAFRQPPIYHRGPEFIDLFQKVRRTLGELVGGRDVALFNGSGTLANEAVAATLAAEPDGSRGGLMLVNGEFGQRLVKQASRFGLEPKVLSWPWGQPWDLDKIKTALADAAPGSWIWGVHMESSTGVLNDLAGLTRLARARGVRVCVDCISSLGAVPINLRDVYLASGATGKSLGSYAGIAIVFADAAALNGLQTANMPSYLDVPAALATTGPCYTFPSPVLFALEAALSAYADPHAARARYEHYAAQGVWVRRQLRELGMEPLAADAWASPVITTWAPPGSESSAAFVERCRTWGFAIGGQSGYLADRRLVQVATMGAITREAYAPLFDHFRRWRAPTATLAG